MNTATLPSDQETIADRASESAVKITGSKPGRWKRRLKRTSVVLLVLLLCTGFALKNHIRTLNSLRRIPGTKAYVMDYYVDYNMAEVRANGIDVDQVDDSFLAVFFPKWILPVAERLKKSFLPEAIETIPTGDHCSTVAFRAANGHMFFGRNLDYYHDSCLIIKVHGPKGVASVAVLDLHYLNLDRDDLDETNLFQRIPLLFAPYYLQDGMNQHGVAVSDMAVHDVKPPRDPSKPNIIHSAAMRLILDYAKSTDEAIEILKQYNIHFVAETCHLMIADATGKSVVIEFIDGQIKPTPTNENWQVCTNHRLAGKLEAENDQCCSRYRTASATLADLRGKGDATDVMKVMQSVSKADWTMWSSVYDLTTGEFEVAYRQHFDDIYGDRLN
jgi:Acyl-coenzyme A:6-aminopenicillanic acid acyl-transferase